MESEKLDRIIELLEKQNKFLAIIANSAGIPDNAAVGGGGRSKSEPPDTDTPHGTWQDAICPIGRNKGHNGKRLGDLPKGFLVFCAEKVERNPKFPDSEFHDALDEYARLAGLTRPDGGEAPAWAPPASSSSYSQPKDEDFDDSEVPF